MAENSLLHGQNSTENIVTSDGGTKSSPQPIKSTNNAIWCYDATLRSGEDETNNVMVVEEGQYGYEVVPVTTQTTLGATGAVGDFLHKILADNATTSIVIKDDTTTVYTWTITAGTEPNELTLNVVSSAGVWSLTCTGGGATAIGRFT